MLRHNYHTHTYRCGHAVGEDEDYVFEAIGLGLQTLGFSDHVMLEGFSQPGVRGDFELSEDYFTSIRELKEKYKERINILLGFEAEPFPEYFSYYKEILEKGTVDYLLVGNHCKIVDNKAKPFFSRNTTKEDIIEYKDTLIRGMETGLFLYVCHPDYFMGAYAEFDKTCILCSEEICKCAARLDIPLEFNFAAIRRGKYKLGGEERFLYPHVEFWKIARKYNCKVVLGLDAHAPSEIVHERNDWGYKLVKDLKLNVVDKLDLSEYKKKINY